MTTMTPLLASFTDAKARRRERGQTLVMALIILGILLIMGFVFIGILNRSIQTVGRMNTRSLAQDLAEAGTRYAHAQLLQSEQGADWRGRPTPMADVDVNDPTDNDTVDPDALYIRPGTNLPLTSDADPRLDLGGPDGLGPFVRVNFEQGRALVRVRFAPSDANLFTNDPTGPLRNPGAARNYTIIESIGRPGVVRFNDPTTLSGNQARKFRGFASGTEFRTEFALMRDQDKRQISSRRLIAYVSIGIIESARFITNINRVSRAAEIGVPRELGAIFQDVDAVVPTTVQPPMLLGMPQTLINFNGTTQAGIPGFGSFFSNADVTVHGDLIVGLNASLGDLFGVAGNIVGADSTATLTIQRSQINRATGVWESATVGPLSGAGNLNSRSPAFQTQRGVLRDGMAGTDSQGYARGIGRKTPPNILTADPETGALRYVMMTRESGFLAQRGNSGRYGHGRGVYVDNTADRQIGSTEEERETAGTAESLVYDWLNPSSGIANSGWRGPFYIPPGAVVQLLPDGFLITRNREAYRGRARGTWRRPDGSDTNEATIRYRLGPGTNGVRRIVNTFTPGVNINGALGVSDFDRGQPFNGVLFFEGNARVRGTIPTDVQISLVSNATIYIEGSITKGVVNPATGGRLNRPSRSMLMLMAREYVAVNPTMFFGPAPTQDVIVEDDIRTATGFSPVRMTVAESSPGSNRLNFVTELPLNPEETTTENNPSLWGTYAENYRPSNDPGQVSPTLLMLSHASDDGPAPVSIFAMSVNEGELNPQYLFSSGFPNSASGYYLPPVPGSVTEYGLGEGVWQRYPKFESAGFPLVVPGTIGGAVGTPSFASTDPTRGAYTLYRQGTNVIGLRSSTVGNAPTNDTLVARAALMPHDVRIEASCYAQEGSFFVIPGQWFNPQPNDTRAEWARDFAAAAGDPATKRAIANDQRLIDFGSTEDMPFYGEPPNVRVVVLGSVSENMPPPISQQGEWLKKWGWMPRRTGLQRIGATETPRLIPGVHIPGLFQSTSTSPYRNVPYVPNLIIAYDPALATGRTGGTLSGGFQYVNDGDLIDQVGEIIRRDELGRPLPPMPRLPVSPSLAYFGEVNP